MLLRNLERCLYVGSFVALGVFANGYIAPLVSAKEAVASFENSKQLMITSPDTALWSPQRIAAYDDSRALKNTAIGVLKIEDVSIEAPIFAGDSEQSLDRGVGWIRGTMPLGQDGNVGLAAHRDGFFRGLKDIEVGDVAIVETLGGERTYRVTGTAIVSPEDTYVLSPTFGATLTLVTCYPFYFVGSAPERFVVYAMAVSPTTSE